MSDYSFSGLARGVVEQLLADLHTCLPARIISFSADSQKATVQPLIKARYTDAEGNDLGLQEMAPIPNLQLLTLGSDNATITFPVKIGSMVLVLFSERSIDTFSYSNGDSPVDPDDLRMHDYNDAFALCLGNLTFPKALGIDPDNTVIRMNAGLPNESKFVMKPDGNVEVYSSNQMVINTDADTVINSSANAIINAESAIVNCDSTINGDLAVNGNVTISGTSSAQDHLSSGISGASHTHPFLAKAGTDPLTTNSPSV